MARVMLLNKQIPQNFLGEVVNTSCHIGNRIFFQVGTKKTVLGSKDLGFHVFRTLMCIVGKP